MIYFNYDIDDSIRKAEDVAEDLLHALNLSTEAGHYKFLEYVVHVYFISGC